MKLAVTGCGVVSPLGIGREAFVDGLASEDPRAIAFTSPSELLDPALDAISAEVSAFDAKAWLGKKGHRNFDRLTKFLITAAKLALRDAKLKTDDAEWIGVSPSRAGICSATAYGSLDAITELNRVAELEAPRYINPARFPNTVINAAAGYVSIWEDLRAPNTTIVDGNCGALDAVLTAKTHLDHDRGDVFLVGGGEVVSEPLYLALRKLELIRDQSAGLECGEGAAYVVVERPAEADARGAKILCEITGYGTAFEPPTSEALLAHVSEAAVARAMEEALADAKLKASDVDIVSSAAGGIARFDEAELRGIARVCPDAAVLAPKQFFGETFGAAGALAMAHAVAMFEGGSVLPLVRGTATSTPTSIIALAVGHYGNVSAVVLRAPR